MNDVCWRNENTQGYQYKWEGQIRTESDHRISCFVSYWPHTTLSYPRMRLTRDTERVTYPESLDFGVIQTVVFHIHSSTLHVDDDVFRDTDYTERTGWDFACAERGWHAIG